MDNSTLYNEDTFYEAFIQDIIHCENELIIESPYVTSNRIALLLPYFKKLLNKNVKIIIVTKHPSEQSYTMAQQTRYLVQLFKNIGIQAYYCGKHHRKLAIVDRKILYEGSLNILSYSYSSELMRRIEGEIYAQEMIKFANLNKII